MLEKELFALLGKTADAAFTVTESGEICSWNEAAEHLFGYAASEVIGRNIDEVIEARGALGGLPSGRSSDSAKRADGLPAPVPNFDLEVRTKFHPATRRADP